MEINNRITFYMAILVVSTMILLPCTNAQQMGGRGSRGGDMDFGPPGSMSGRDGMGGDMDFGPPGSMSGRGGDRGRGGPGSWMDREAITDFQISLILKAYSTRNPTEAKKLQDQRKDMSRETFVQTLISPRHAFSDYLPIMSEERHYTQILNWCEKYVSDEATGIKEVKEDNYDLYKKRIDTLENRYSSIIYRPNNTPEELIPVLVKDLQLNTRQNELLWQIRIADNQDKKNSLTNSLEEVVAELYDLNIQQRIIQLKQIQNQIDNLVKNLKFEMAQIDTIKDPNVAKEEIRDRVDRLLNSGFLGGSPFGRGGRPGGGRSNRQPPPFTPYDINDQKRNPAP